VLPFEYQLVVEELYYMKADGDDQGHQQSVVPEASYIYVWTGVVFVVIEAVLLIIFFVGQLVELANFSLKHVFAKDCEHDGRGDNQWSGQRVDDQSRFPLLRLLIHGKLNFVYLLRLDVSLLQLFIFDSIDKFLLDNLPPSCLGDAGDAYDKQKQHIELKLGEDVLGPDVEQYALNHD